MTNSAIRVIEDEERAILRMARDFSLENIISEEANTAYIRLVGREYAKPEDAEEAYQGEYDSDGEFAEQLCADIYGDVLDSTPEWILRNIDWEGVSEDLMHDYSEQDGYYFRNL